MNKTKIVAGLLLSGVSLGMAQAAFAASAVSDGNYVLQIQTTPQVYSSSLNVFVGLVGNATAGWNSSFTTGAGTPSYGSNFMYDNGNLGASVGSSIAGDGFAGVVGLSVSNGVFNITSFNVDTISGTCCGYFGQSGVVTGGGVIDAAGNMILTPTGRMGSFDGFYPPFTQAWNIEPGTSNYAAFTTGTDSNNYLGSVTGRVVTAIGDINADGNIDYSVTLVSSGQMGTEWGPGLEGIGYIEVWKANIVSAPVPVPAAAWLLGSGLLGLIGVARRRR